MMESKEELKKLTNLFHAFSESVSNTFEGAVDYLKEVDLDPDAIGQKGQKEIENYLKKKKLCEIKFDRVPITTLLPDFEEIFKLFPQEFFLAASELFTRKKIEKPIYHTLYEHASLTESDHDEFSHDNYDYEIIIVNQLVEHYLKRWEYRKAWTIISELEARMENLWRPEAMGSAYLHFLKGLHFQSRGFFKTAIPFHEIALDAVESLGDQHLSLEGKRLNAQIIDHLGICLIEMDKQAEGEALLKQARDLKQEYFPENHLAYAQNYIHFGTYYGILGNYEKQRFYYEDALKITEAILPEEDLFIADCHEFLGYCQANLGNYEDSEDHHTQAYKIRLEHFSKNPNHPILGKSKNNFGFLNRKKGTGHYQRSLEFLLEALESFKNADFEHHLKFRILFNIAKSYKELREWDKAIQYHEQAKELREQAYGKNHRHIASSFVNLGRCYLAKGQFKIAINFFEQSLEVRKKTWGDKQHRYVAKCYHDLSKAYFYQCQYYKAIQYAKESLRINNYVFKNQFTRFIGDDHRLIAQCKAHLEQYEEARSLIRDALNEENKSTQTQDILVESYGNLGVSFLLEGDYLKALDAFRVALNIQKLKYPEGLDINLGAIYNYISECYLHIQSYEKALANLQMALTCLCPGFFSLKKSDNPKLDKPESDFRKNIVILKVLQNKTKCLARLYRESERQEDYRAGKKSFAKAVKLLNDILKTIDSEDAKLALIEEEKSIFEEALSLFYDFYSKTGEKRFAYWVFFLVEKWKAILFLDAQKKELENLAFERPEKLIGAVQKQLKKSTLLIEYFAGKKELFSIIISRKDFHLVKITYSEFDEKEPDLSKYCKHFSHAFESWNQDHDTKFDRVYYIDWACKLYNLLIKPIECHFSNGIKRLMIIPDGPLFEIPFAALLSEYSKKLGESKGYQLPFLFKKYILHSHFSAKSLLRNIKERPAKKSKNNTAAIIAPNISQDAKHLKELDMEALYRLHRLKFEKANELFNSEATTENVKKALKKEPKYILIYANCRVPFKKEPFINLAGEDVLKASELHKIRCPADFVLLIGSSGGLGSLSGREGMMAFSWAFLKIGASNVLCSLSRTIYDDAAREILKLTTANTIKNIDSAQALHLAQKEILKTPGIKPIEFLSFIVMGGWSPLTENT